MVTVSNSINASINQQKAVRGYFYYLLKGNSMLPTRSELNNYLDEGITSVAGISTAGWRERSEGESSFAPCFRFSTLFPTSNDSETCEEASEEQISQFVRVFTLYGVCGASLSTNLSRNGYYIYNSPSPVTFSSPGCTLQ